MALASTSHASFITSNFHSPARNSTRRARQLSFPSCKASLEPETTGTSSEKKGLYNELNLAKLAAVTLAAGVLVLGSVDGAMAAKSGGRVGGQAFRSAPRSAPRSSGPRINNNRTNIYINPPVAPGLGGYGYGGYGYGFSPFSFFAPGPSVAVGVGGGLDIFFWFVILGAVGGAVRRFLNRSNDDEYDD